MILSRDDLVDYLEQGKLRFDPEIGLDRVAQVSIDLVLGKKFTEFRDRPGYLPAIQVDHSLWESGDLWDENERETFRLMPGLYGRGRDDHFQHQDSPIPTGSTSRKRSAFRRE